MTPTIRLFAAAACFAAWLVLLFEGYALGGAIHLLAVAGVVLVPWRPAAGGTPPAPPGGSTAPPTLPPRLPEEKR